MQNSRSTLLAWGYAATIFSSAFLLFQVQPLISKYILPWFGGSPGVWTTCLLFFQVLLFGGYAYAHLSASRWQPKTQGMVHIALLASAVALLPIDPSGSWEPHGGEEPTLQIALLLTLTVGLPYFVLSATGPLLQNWFGAIHNGSSPYRLYAVSNVGSLLALLSYPFVFEPAFSTNSQAAIWSLAFLAYAAMCSVCAVLMWNRVKPQPAACIDDGGVLSETVPTPIAARRLLWFFLAMLPSLMLLATTNQVCLDVAVIPFLWVLPLTLYLLSFVLCFDSDCWYSRKGYTLAFAASLAAVCYAMQAGAEPSILTQVAIYFAALFLCCMVCHGELVRLKPDPRYLTSFYLTIAAGGAAGGLFVGLIAPLVFSHYYELHVGIVACCLLAFFLLKSEPQTALTWSHFRLPWMGVVVGSAVLITGFSSRQAKVESELPVISRNFYGVIRVDEEHHEEPERRIRRMHHGRIVHGRQFTHPDKKRQPTSYYSEQSGVGLALRSHHANRPKHVGVVGLGAGTLAAYGRPEDRYRFYEINPEVIRLAERHFTFLSDCPADVQVILGDARISLKQEPEQHFDVLVIDAFSGDAIPIHLLTHEAFQVYLRHLEPDGLLALHITNRHLDLRPVVAGLADDFDLSYVDVFNESDETQEISTSQWALLALQPDLLQHETIQQAATPFEGKRLHWTDDRNNLFEVLR